MNARRLTSATLAALYAVTAALLMSSATALAARGHVFDKSFGASGGGGGEFNGPAGVAVNESTGDVYVVDESNDRVEWFSATGGYLGEFNGSGTFEVEGKVEEGAPAPPAPLSAPEGIAVDNDPLSPSFGDVYVIDTGNKVIDKSVRRANTSGQISEANGSNLWSRIWRRGRR